VHQGVQSLAGESSVRYPIATPDAVLLGFGSDLDSESFGAAVGSQVLYHASFVFATK
jgi:hypothetical protein